MSGISTCSLFEYTCGAVLIVRHFGLALDPASRVRVRRVASQLTGSINSSKQQMRQRVLVLDNAVFTRNESI